MANCGTCNHREVCRCFPNPEEYCCDFEPERPHGEWIPCSERLPEKQGQYYVSGGDKVWICDFLIFSNFKGGWCNNVSNPKVEAWMPLPEPFKRGEAE